MLPDRKSSGMFGQRNGEVTAVTAGARKWLRADLVAQSTSPAPAFMRKSSRRERLAVSVESWRKE